MNEHDLNEKYITDAWKINLLCQEIKILEERVTFYKSNLGLCFLGWLVTAVLFCVFTFVK